MLDYWKVWIRDPAQIERVLHNPILKKKFTVEEDGTIVGTKGEYLNWVIVPLSRNLLQISGSIHKYWNYGTNENDFTFADVQDAIHRFCHDFDLDPALALIKNLEFGVNLQLPIPASDVIEQIVAFNYNPAPISPYRRRPDCFFVEYETTDYFLKIYDKGKQYGRQLPGTPDTLRMELKAMRARYLNQLEIVTLADLQDPRKLQVLAWKFAKTLKTGLVLDDDTINAKALTPKERTLYRRLESKKFWKKAKGRSSSSIRAQISRFKALVEGKGQRRIYGLIWAAIASKMHYLAGETQTADFHPSLYPETQPTRPVSSLK